MIYQAYYLPDQEPYLIRDPFYFPVCLQPERLTSIPSFDIRKTEPLADSAIRQQLCEYSAMLAVWKQRPHANDWIGFTSWRQFQKGFDFRFDDAALDRVMRGETVCWGIRTLDETLHQHAERCHPGITGVLAVLLREVHGQRLSDRYFTNRTAPFSNYWAMSWIDFDRYMAWSWLVIKSAIDRWGIDPPFNLFPIKGTQDRSIAFLQERLFIIWWLRVRAEKTGT
jgi:hypothetical protein